MAHRSLTVEMNVLLDCLSGSNQVFGSGFLDKLTGAIVFASDDRLDDDAGDETLLAIEQEPERYAEIPRLETRDSYEVMCRFARSVEEDDVREMLELALNGKGAFARFREVLYRYPDLQARWLNEQRETQLEEATRWLHGLGIEPRYDLVPIVCGPSNQDEPAGARPKVELLDLLLLGAPDRKAEIMGGRVRRLWLAKTASEARAAFKGLARQISEFYGVPWRKRHIEGKDTFDMERMHLRLEGSRVELDVDVPKPAWQAFALHKGV